MVNIHASVIDGDSMPIDDVFIDYVENAVWATERFNMELSLSFSLLLNDFFTICLSITASNSVKLKSSQSEWRKKSEDGIMDHGS